jgi:hypothetical protein
VSLPLEFDYRSIIGDLPERRRTVALEGRLNEDETESLKLLEATPSHHDSAGMVVEATGGRTVVPCSTATSSLAEKMKPMPSIHIIPERFLR